MAGDWIAMRVDLADDPAVIQIAASLGIDEYGVIGRLHKIWCWASAQTVDGHVHVAKMSRCERDKCHAAVPFSSRSCPDPVPDVSQACPATVALEAWIDRYVVATGFCSAMVEVGWLVRSDDGLLFPKFDRWNAQTAKQRLLASKRKAASRAEKSQIGKTIGPTDVPKMSRSQRDENGTTGQDSTGEREEEEERTSSATATLFPDDVPLPKKASPVARERPEDVPIPAHLDTPEFREVWSEWLAVGRERKKKLTARAARMQLKILSGARTPDEAIGCIEYSIAGGYPTVYADRLLPTAKSETQRGPAKPKFETQEDRILRQVQEAIDRDE